MRRKTIGFAAAVAGLIAVPMAASALTAVTTEPVALRAGPAADFPIVDSIPDDARVNVHGCVRAYRWCDVSWRDARGWVRGDDLSYYYQQSYVPIIEYGPRIGLPVIAFGFDSYWDRHYRGRPWYSERTRWRSAWRNHDGRDGRRGVVERRQGTPDRRADRTPNRPDRVEKRVDRSKTIERSRPEGRVDRGDRQPRMSEPRKRDAAPRREGGREAVVRERPGRDGGGAAQRGPGGGRNGGGEGPRDRN